METIRFKNRFRILYKGKILALNNITNVKGYSQFTQSFTKLQDAIDSRRVYAIIRGIEEEDMKIESYSENERHLVPNFSKDANEILKKRKIFSGKGLRFKNLESPKDNKYNQSKYYGQDVQFAKSVEFSKGLTVNKFAKKRSSSGGSEQFEKLSKRDHGTFTLGDSVVDNLKKKNMGRKALRRYLRANGYTVGQAITLIEKVYA